MGRRRIKPIRNGQIPACSKIPHLSKAKVVETAGKIRCWTAPVLADGRIYVRTNTGGLVCVDVSTTPSTAQEDIN